MKQTEADKTEGPYKEAEKLMEEVLGALQPPRDTDPDQIMAVVALAIEFRELIQPNDKLAKVLTCYAVTRACMARMERDERSVVA